MTLDEKIGQPLAVASTLNRLQRVARVPLHVAADFETGAGMRIAGATAFPRAIGVHLNLAPVSDVNNNPRNPVINTRWFGEEPGGLRQWWTHPCARCSRTECLPR